MQNWRRISFLLCGAMLSVASGLSAPIAADAAPRLASLDYCADQFVLALSPGSDIAAVSIDATSVYSFFGEKAAGLPKLRGNAEEILTLAPTLLVRQWKGSAAVDALLAQAGIATFILPFTLTPEDELSSLVAFGAHIGREAEARSFVDKRTRMRSRLEEAPQLPLKALYVTPSGFTAGQGTGVDNIIQWAGLDTMAKTYGLSGWGALPMEAIVRNQPDVIVTSFFDLPRAPSNWSLSGHPRIEEFLRDLPVIDLPARYMACSNLFAIDAANYIRREAEKLGLARDRQAAERTTTKR